MEKKKKKKKEKKEKRRREREKKGRGTKLEGWGVQLGGGGRTCGWWAEGVGEGNDVEASALPQEAKVVLPQWRLKALGSTSTAARNAALVP